MYEENLVKLVAAIRAIYDSAKSSFLKELNYAERVFSVT